MRLAFRRIEGWKKLAWVAIARIPSDTVTVLHGAAVETSPEWCIEGVWGGDFAQGDFDRTDIVCGTGVRLRGNQVVFVNPGNTLDRIWHCSTHEQLCVSNSLPALLAVTNLNLIADHKYSTDLGTIVKGLKKYARDFPTDGAPLRLTYFHNLVFDGQRLEEACKPKTAPPLRTFDDYEGYLLRSAERIRANYESKDRRERIGALAAISRGYDSPAAAVIARHAGCRRAVTITKSSSLFRRDDSGAEIADHLRLACRKYEHRPGYYNSELDIWSVLGGSMDLNLTVFDYGPGMTLLFTGFHGDKIWDRKVHQLTDIRRGDLSGAGFTEFRLRHGIIQCAVPFWGILDGADIQRVSCQPEMLPWTLHNSYDRPIPRRIVEAAGVPRTAFGANKEASAVQFCLLPHAPDLEQDFRQFLGSRGLAPHTRLRARVVKLYRHALSGSKKIPWLGKKLSVGKLIKKTDTPGDWFFLWANTRLKEEYAHELRAADELAHVD